MSRVCPLPIVGYHTSTADITPEPPAPTKLHHTLIITPIQIGLHLQLPTGQVEACRIRRTF
jgi:hypothetical protein